MINNYQYCEPSNADIIKSRQMKCKNINRWLSVSCWLKEVTFSSGKIQENTVWRSVFLAV